MSSLGAGGLPEDKFELNKIERRIILGKLYDAVDFLHDKAFNKRIQEKELKFVKLRVDMFKAMAYIATSYNTLAKDSELEQLQKELEELKKQISEE